MLFAMQAPHRRDFLKSAAGVAAVSAAPAPGSLPKVRLGEHEVSRLILGENPLYGYSHFNRLLSDLMKEYCTPEKVVELLHRAERAGITAWEFTHSDRSFSDLARYREQGGKMQVMFLSSRPMVDKPEVIAEVARLRPIAMMYHGGMTDRAFAEGRRNEVREWLKRVRQTGALAGMSTHNPRNIEIVEEEGWQVDFYMACFYRLTRTPQEIRAITTEIPLPAAEVYLEGDPERMCRVIRQTRKPCLGFKILAAGRKCDSPAAVEQAFRFAFDNIKSTDCVIVGMFPKFQDQITANADLVRRIVPGVS